MGSSVVFGVPGPACAVPDQMLGRGCLVTYGRLKMGSELRNVMKLLQNFFEDCSVMVGTPGAC